MKSFIAKTEIRPIDTLKNWDKNPRGITEKRFAELKLRIQRLGQLEPLKITKDGTVIGGNMRLRAYRELGIKDVLVSVTNAETDQEIFEIAITDNEEFGYYEKEALAELAQELNFPTDILEEFSINLRPTTTIGAVLSDIGPNEDGNEKEVNFLATSHTCPKCGYEF